MSGIEDDFSIFTDSEAFAAIYFYSYALVIVSILIAATYFATKVQLYHHTYDLFKEFEILFAQMTLGVEGFKSKCIFDTKIANGESLIGWQQASFDRLQGLNADVVKFYVHTIFNQIRDALDKHEAYMIARIDQIEEKYGPDGARERLRKKQLRQAEYAHDGVINVIRIASTGTRRESSKNGLTPTKSIRSTTGRATQMLDVQINLADLHSNSMHKIDESKTMTMDESVGLGDSDYSAQGEDKETMVIAPDDAGTGAGGAGGDEEEVMKLSSNNSTTQNGDFKYGKKRSVDNNSEPVTPLAPETNKLTNIDSNASNQSNNNENDYWGYPYTEDMTGNDEHREYLIDIVAMDDNHPTMDKVRSYVGQEYANYKLTNAKGFALFSKVLYKIRSLFVPPLTHFFDTATDIALVWEWYLLYKNDTYSSENIYMFAFFMCALSTIVYYRISSAYEVFQFTGNKWDALLQFFFDFFLIKLIYVNMFKLRSYSASYIIKQFRMLEGGNEAAFQAVLSLVFLIKTDFSQATTITIVSFFASVLSLVSRLSLLDKTVLMTKTNEDDNGKSSIDITDLCRPRRLIGKIDGQWLFKRAFRSFEILFSIFLIAVFWDIVGMFCTLFYFVVFFCFPRSAEKCVVRPFFFGLLWCRGGVLSSVNWVGCAHTTCAG